MINADLVHDAHSALGEGVIWSPVEELLLWIDITGGDVYRYSHADGPVVVTHLDGTIGSIAPRIQGGWVLGLGPGVALTDADDQIVEQIVLPGVPDTHRTNDGAVDPAGRLFQGTMKLDETTALAQRAPDAALYRLDTDRSVRSVVDGVTISNGIGWSLDNTLMYYVDTATFGVDVFDYDIDTGEIEGRRPLAVFDGSYGGPDGMTVDDDGCLWVAFFHGGCVRRYSPEGELLEIVAVDAPNVTSCAFGGPDLDTLYITTARHGLGPDAADANPASGGLFAADVDATGRPTNLFGS